MNPNARLITVWTILTLLGGCATRRASTHDATSQHRCVVWNTTASRCSPTTGLCGCELLGAAYVPDNQMVMTNQGPPLSRDTVGGIAQTAFFLAPLFRK